MTRRKGRQHPLRSLVRFVGALWVLELVDLFVFGGQLDLLGIRPRTLEGLRGVVFAPLLHGGLGHVAANTFPLLILGSLVLLSGAGRFAGVTALSWLVGGLGTWLTGGANSIHIGASILVFGYLGYLLARAYYERSLRTFFTALVVGFLYGGALLGVLPLRADVSWQGHLFGLVGGIMAAQWSAKSVQN